LPVAALDPMLSLANVCYPQHRRKGK